MTDYTLQQAQADVASLRGQLAHLLASAEFINLQVDNAATFTNAANIVQPGSIPAAPESWHNMPAMTASWAIGAGFAKYRLTVDGYLAFSFAPATIGTHSDNTTIWAAGSLPAAYRPANAKRWPMSTSANSLSANQTPWMGFLADGSIIVAGIATGTISVVHAHGVLPLI